MSRLRKHTQGIEAVTHPNNVPEKLGAVDNAISIAVQIFDDGAEFVLGEKYVECPLDLLAELSWLQAGALEAPKPCCPRQPCAVMHVGEARLFELAEA